MASNVETEFLPLRVASIIFFILGTLGVGVRIYVRGIMLRRLGTDDYLMLGSLVSLLHLFSRLENTLKDLCACWLTSNFDVTGTNSSFMVRPQHWLSR